MLTNKAKYALRAMRYLAQRYLAQRGGKTPASISSIASDCVIPRRFLENILIELRRAHLVESYRGKTGGYVLARAPTKITWADIIRAIDGPIAWASCASKQFYRSCEERPSEDGCEIRRVMVEVREACVAILERITLDKPLQAGV